MKINDKVPNDFLKWQKSLKRSIEAMGVKQSYIYRGIGMSKTTWDRRNKKFDFTADEAIRICRLLNK